MKSRPSEEDKKGKLPPGQLADLAVLTADYFAIPAEEIKALESVLTIVGGTIVHATEEFSKLSPPSLQGGEVLDLKPAADWPVPDLS